MAEGAAPTRVVVIDDDDLSRRGIVAILNDDPRVEVVASGDHDTALAALSSWPDVDVALVDAADTRRTDDHFVGASVVAAIRRRWPRQQVTVIVITGHFFNDAVRRRMREAEADLFFHRTELQDASVLCDTVADPPGAGAAPVPDPLDPEAQFRLGVTDASRVNDAVAHGLADPWVDDATGRPPGPRSRSWGHLRERFNEVARLNPVTSDGRPPDREQTTPSRPQFERFLRWATRADR